MDRRINVFLIDDEQDFTESVSFWLESKGYYVKSAATGKEGLQMIKDEKPDIVFLDLHLPEMDGIQILSNIRKIDKDIPVVMITAYAEEKKMDEARKLGASGFFPKKSRLEELGNMIEVTLKTHKQLQDKEEK
jgi:CheY-like chemotaxis protein